jgi:hypothetical protein
MEYQILRAFNLENVLERIPEGWALHGDPWRIADDELTRREGPTYHWAAIIFRVHPVATKSELLQTLAKMLGEPVTTPIDKLINLFEERKFTPS